MADSSKAEEATKPTKDQDKGSKDASDQRPRDIPAVAYEEVDSSFLSAVFGSDKNVRPSSTNNSTLHRSTLSKATVRYSKQSSDEDLEARRKVVLTPLSNDRAQAMGAGQRFLNNLRASNWRIADDRAADSEDQGIHMYRMHAATSTNSGFCQSISSFACGIVNCGAVSDLPTTSMNDRQTPNQWITTFFHWLYRRGWRTVFFISLLNFYILVMLFTLLLVIWTTYVDNDCVVVGGVPIGTLPKRSIWMDAFSLSWNTISTVGYGSTYPSLSTEHNHEGDKTCSFISFLTSLEAFVGVVYAGFTGGIIFAKVTRLAQRARVKFSDPLLVKFGSGLESNSPANDGSTPRADDVEANAKDAALTSPTPFPVLEFRLANELHHVPSSEIISSQVHAVVLIEAQQDGEEVNEELAKQIKMERLKRTSKARRKSSVSKQNPFKSTIEASSHSNLSSQSIDDTVSVRSSESSKASVTDKRKHYFGHKKIKIDEEVAVDGGVIVPRMIFYKLSLDHSDHPFFKRLWTFRHTINAESPLLSNAAKQHILENGGTWPSSWNDAQSVRNAIRFNQIVVSFTGVSNISAADVYKQKVYDYVDLVCGYQFINPLYRSTSGKLKVDMKLMNDVVEQNGGGGEPLNVIIE